MSNNNKEYDEQQNKNLYPLSALEKIREENIRKNNEFLVSCGFINKSVNYSSTSSQPPPRKQTRKLFNTSPERKSQRIALNCSNKFDNDDIPSQRIVINNYKNVSSTVKEGLNIRRQENENIISSIVLNDFSSDELKEFILSKKDDDECFHSDLAIISYGMISKVNAFMCFMNESKLKVRLNAIMKK